MLEKISTRLEDVMPLIREALDCGGAVRIHPRGASMLPMIREGRDSVVLSALPEKLKKYDVILYRRDDGQFVLHRLVSTKNGYVFWGDNHYEVEYGIEYLHMIARVSSFYRDDKQIDVNSAGYRLYCRLWYGTRGIRKLISRISGLVHRIFNKK